jgi:hypothetical protein
LDSGVPGISSHFHPLLAVPVGRASELHSIDGRVDETRTGVEDPDELFSVVLETARSGRAVDSVHRGTFVVIYAALWNSGLYDSVCSQLGDAVTMENAVDRLRFL